MCFQINIYEYSCVLGIIWWPHYKNAGQSWVSTCYGEYVISFGSNGLNMSFNKRNSRRINILNSKYSWVIWHSVHIYSGSATAREKPQRVCLIHMWHCRCFTAFHAWRSIAEPICNIPTFSSLPKAVLSPSAEQFQRPLLNWNWHSSMPIWIPSPMIMMASGRLWQIIRCRGAKPGILLQIILAPSATTDEKPLKGSQKEKQYFRGLPKEILRKGP